MSCILGCNSTHFDSSDCEKQVDIVVQSIPECFVVFGQITDCSKNNQPVIGALVKVFKCVDKKLIPICHTFSGCNGYYMLNVPQVTSQDKIVLMATCSCVTTKICASCQPDCNCKSHC